MAVGVWTPMTLPANATGTLQYLLAPDGLVRFRGILTHVGATFTSVNINMPNEILPIHPLNYFDWTGVATDANIRTIASIIYFGASNLGSPGKTWPAGEIAAMAWGAAIPTAAASLTADIYDRLRSDGILTNLLASYGSPPTPAIFTAPPIPEDATLPAIVVEAPDDEAPDDTKTTTGRKITRAVTVYTDATGDMGAVETIARRVVDLFHRQPLLGHWRTTAYGPATTPTDGTLYGRRIVLEMTR